MDQLCVLSQVPVQTLKPYVSYFLSLDGPSLNMGKWWIVPERHLYPFCIVMEETFIQVSYNLLE